MLLVILNFFTAILALILEIYLLHPSAVLPEVRNCVRLFWCFFFHRERVIFVCVVIFAVFLGAVSSVLKRMMFFSGEFACFFGNTKFHRAIYLFRTIADPKHNIIRIDIFILPKLINLPPRFFRALRPIPIFLTRCQSTRRIL